MNTTTIMAKGNETMRGTDWGAKEINSLVYETMFFLEDSFAHCLITCMHNIHLYNSYSFIVTMLLLLLLLLLLHWRQLQMKVQYTLYNAINNVRTYVHTPSHTRTHTNYTRKWLSPYKLNSNTFDYFTCCTHGGKQQPAFDKQQKRLLCPIFRWHSLRRYLSGVYIHIRLCVSKCHTAK